MTKADIIAVVRKQLTGHSDDSVKATGKGFFKENIKSYGVKVPVVNQIAKEQFKSIRNHPKDEIFDLCEQLWQSGYIEESLVACKWSHALRRSFEPKDFQVFKKWIDSYVDNWASCDTFCNHTIGEFIQMYPEYIPELTKFALSKNRWMRRAAAVSFIVPARKGKFLKEILEIADLLLTDQDDLVQKGYGWMLKVASKDHQKEVFNYVMKNKAQMPRTALRYAIEKMPKELKSKAMDK
ncbi:DNA alkylation repair protein [Flagellimonas nanhaiensis]|uniref:DNA alkylation repair protein n=1 Tax=Flagellimonas nanhaiensis TaxID=2292706 RepID=A0A371JTF8_9FLAO|nr:DNA alkylation repair protein [Allomuricauda nanhaiensis]RDY61049.1 DNA alkylation repair protein [Allomuricauda nanhaiensis]